MQTPCNVLNQGAKDLCAAKQTFFFFSIVSPEKTHVEVNFLTLNCSVNSYPELHFITLFQGWGQFLHDVTVSSFWTTQQIVNPNAKYY